MTSLGWWGVGNGVLVGGDLEVIVQAGHQQRRDTTPIDLVDVRSSFDQAPHPGRPAVSPHIVLSISSMFQSRTLPPKTVHAREMLYGESSFTFFLLLLSATTFQNRDRLAARLCSRFARRCEEYFVEALDLTSARRAAPSCGRGSGREAVAGARLAGLGCVRLTAVCSQPVFRVRTVLDEVAARSRQAVA